MRLKAISPFIASVLLIGFTISTGIIIYYFLTTLPKVQTQQVSSLGQQVISCAGGFFDVNTLPVGIYRKAITIDNTLNSDNLNDYQVLITNPIYNETGLVLSLHFNEGSGNIAYDSSGNNNHGNLVNGPTWVDGKFGKALSFDGVDDYVNVPTGIPSSILGRNPKMVILWFYPTQYRNGIVYMGPSGGGGAGNSFRFVTNASGNLGLDVSYGIAFSSIKIDLNTWNFVFAYWNGSSYFVGKVTADSIQKQSLSLPANNLQQGLLRVGQEQANNYYGKGIIDELRIYNRVLSDDEILALYQAKARLDYEDIRFTDSDGSTLLNYWQEADGRFWVKVPNIPASSSTTIYVYYGNPSATSESSVQNTFIANSIYAMSGSCTDSTNCYYMDNHVEADNIRGYPANICTKYVDKIYWGSVCDNSNPGSNVRDHFYSRFRFLFVPDVSGTW